MSGKIPTRSSWIVSLLVGNSHLRRSLTRLETSNKALPGRDHQASSFQAQISSWNSVRQMSTKRNIVSQTGSKKFLSSHLQRWSKNPLETQQPRRKLENSALLSKELQSARTYSRTFKRADHSQNSTTIKITTWMAFLGKCLPLLQVYKEHHYFHLNLRQILWEVVAADELLAVDRLAAWS